MLVKRRILSVIVFIIVSILIIKLPLSVSAAQVKAGSGSYTDVLPSGCISPQSTIYKTSNLKGAIPTSSWESSILWYQYSLPIFAHPLTFCFKPEGLEIGNPALGGGGIAYFGPHKNDFSIGHSSIGVFPDVQADKISDFAVDAVMYSGNAGFKSTIVKGSPYAYFAFTGGNPVISFFSAPVLFYGNWDTQCLGVTINGVNYGLFAPTGSTWQGIGTGTVTCILPSGKNYFSIAVLPDNSIQTLLYYKERAYSFVTDTKVNWEYDEENSRVTTTFSVETTPMEGTNKNTIFALYPHQWRNNPHISTLPYSYSTLRGIMKTTEGTSFKTEYKYQGILPSLPDKGTYDKSILNSYINELTAQANSPQSQDT
ncbi:MAG TPA: glycoside hydrolase, partial [Acetivibrio sp.]|nr:glycoside hydrolase [Acetivibrio sp.]